MLVSSSGWFEHRIFWSIQSWRMICKNWGWLFENFYLHIKIILFIYDFQLYFCFLKILHRVFTQDLAWGKRVIISNLCIYVFYYLFRVIFFSNVDSTIPKRWVDPLCTAVCISYRLGLLGSLLICLFLRFFIISKVPTITGTMVVFRRHIFIYNFFCKIFVFIYSIMILN